MWKIPILTNMFQAAWNHQLVTLLACLNFFLTTLQIHMDFFRYFCSNVMEGSQLGSWKRCRNKIWDAQIYARKKSQNHEAGWRVQRLILGGEFIRTNMTTPKTIWISTENWWLEDVMSFWKRSLFRGYVNFLGGITFFEFSWFSEIELIPPKTS